MLVDLNKITAQDLEGGALFVCTVSPEIMAEQREELIQALEQMGQILDGLATPKRVLVMPDGMTLATVPEQTMNEAGWVRVPVTQNPPSS